MSVPIGLCPAILAVLALAFSSALAAETATCTLVAGNSTTVTGTIMLSQEGATLTVTGNVVGLAAGKHGFHIHTYGDVGNACVSAGPHYNPNNATHGAPTDAVRHVGDLGNVMAVADTPTSISITDTVATLAAIAGRAMVVHAMEDDLGLGNETDSKTTGHAGARLACCIITTATSTPITAAPTATTTTTTTTVAGATTTTRATSGAVTVTLASVLVVGLSVVVAAL